MHAIRDEARLRFITKNHEEVYAGDVTPLHLPPLPSLRTIE